MIIEYHRPENLQEALTLLAREEPTTYPLGGGSVINRGMEGQYAVVDLQALELGAVSMAGNQVHAGATTTLQQLLEFDGLPEDLYSSIQHEVTYNLRQIATIAGTLVTATGRSPFTTVMLALDTNLDRIDYEGTPEQIKLGDWLPIRAGKPEKLITRIIFPLNVKLAFETIARTPADQPIVCTAVAQWSSGRTRVVLGGWGKTPILALDGPESGGVETAARNAYCQAADEWASAEYRQEMAGILSSRCFGRLNK